MAEMLIHDAKSAYKYPLLIKQLWHAPLVQAPDQVIVYRDMKRFTYRQLRERIGGSRPASPNSASAPATPSACSTGTAINSSRPTLPFQ